MDKKTYKQPSLKVIELDSNDIICGSTGEPTPMSLYDDEVQEEQRPENISVDIWGSQW